MFIVSIEREGIKQQLKPVCRKDGVSLNNLLYHYEVQSPASEQPVDLFSLRVQVDVIETRPGGQTGDRRHLRKTAGKLSAILAVQKHIDRKVCLQ